MTFDTLMLDKGLYTSEKGFTKSLEEIDPSENYKGTELEGLDAYERQLKRFDIKVKGRNSDPVSKFFQSSNAAVLFPEYIKRAVSSVMDHDNIIDDIVATTTVINSLDYRSVQCIAEEPTALHEQFINEGAFIPETKIETKDNLTKLRKTGRTLSASYESIKSQRLDLFSVMLKQIGHYISHCQLSQAITALDNKYTLSVENQVDKQICYDDLLNMYVALSPYEFNTIIAETDTFRALINMKEFRDGTSGLNFHGTGNLITPLGAKLLHCKTNQLDSKILAFDKNFALEKVQFGDIVTDFDKLIDRQIERATVTSTVGFNRIIDRACAALDPKV